MKTRRLLSANFLMLGLALILACSFTVPGAVNISANTPAPDSANADSLDLSKYTGKVVVLNFWASWSKASRSENKNLARVYQKYKQNPRVVFVSVSLDTDKANWKTAIEEDELVWPAHICDFQKYDSPIAHKYKVSTLPLIFLVDAKGKIVSSSSRMIDLENNIDALLK